MESESFDVVVLLANIGCITMIFGGSSMRFLRLIFLVLALVGSVTLLAAPVALTIEERVWISAHPSVRVGLDSREAPFVFHDKDGKLIGFDIDYLHLIEERTGLRFEFLDGINWVAAMRKATTPPTDVLTGLAAIPGRERYLTYTKSYGFSPVVIIVRDDAPHTITSIDLPGTRLALTEGYEAMNQAILQAAPGVEVTYYKDDEKMLQSVANGECFSAVDDVITASYFIRARGMTNLRLGSALPLPDEIALGVRSDWPELTAILNKAIASVTPAERLAIANRWVGVDMDIDRKWAKAFKITAVVVGIGMLLFLALFLHTRRLQREIDERRRAQRELESVRDGLAAANADKEAILKMVAHDLRSPLTSIVLSADLLTLSESPAESAEATSRIKEASQRMGKLIAELLRQHAPGTEPAKGQGSRCEWVAIVHASLRQAEPAARAKGIRVSTELPASVALGADAGALSQVSDNLINNALKYSPTGATVQVCLSVSEGLARLRVADQGPGVPQAEREKIFEHGAIGSALPTAGEASHGLGLWIVRRLVKEAHGRVWCEQATEQGGAAFVVELPVGQQAPD